MHVGDDLSDDILNDGSVLEQRESEGLNLEKEGVVPLLRLRKEAKTEGEPSDVESDREEEN